MATIPADITIVDADGKLTPHYLHLLSQLVKESTDLKVRVEQLEKRLRDASIP